MATGTAGSTARAYHTRQSHFLVAKVTSSDDGTQITVGKIPAGSVVLNARAEVKVAFDSDGSDLIDIGNSTDTDEFCANLNVAATGTKLDSSTFNAAADKTYTSDTTIVCQYDSSDATNLTTGLAYVVVEYAFDPSVINA